MLDSKPDETNEEFEFNAVDYNPTDYLADVYLQSRGDIV